MAFNIFGKIYVEPDYLYDNGYNRIIFSQERNQAEYTSYEILEREGFESEVLLSTASVNDVVGSEEGQFASIAHYLKHLFDSNWNGRIYSDQDSYMPLFFTWLKIAFPNIDSDAAFTLYNIIKQRESLVFPDNRDAIGFLVPRITARNTNIVLNKVAFLEAMSAFNDGDVTTPEYYNEVRDAVRNELSVEIQLASYLAGAVDISNLSDKIRRISSKILFNIVSDIKDYLRENIMTERVKAMTGVSLDWDDQDWEGTLRSSSAQMNFLFSSDEETIRESLDYRIANLETAWYWCQWLIDNTSESDKDDIELYDLVKAATYAIQYKNAGVEDTAIRHPVAEAIIAEDVAFSGSTIFFQVEHLREKVNTFWIEYIYQNSLAGNTAALQKLSHT